MELAVIATIFYGLLSGVGGVVGYLKSRSKPSLIAGIVSGLLLWISAGLVIQSYSWGLTLSKAVVLCLIIIFALRFRKSGKFMPAGVMLLSGVATICCLFV